MRPAAVDRQGVESAIGIGISCDGVNLQHLPDGAVLSRQALKCCVTPRDPARYAEASGIESRRLIPDVVGGRRAHVRVC